MNLIESVLDAGAAAGADRTAVVWRGERWSYRALRQRSARMAGALASLGVGPGDRIGLMMENRPDCIAALFACAHVGAILATINVELGPGEISDALGRADPKCILLDRAGSLALNQVTEGSSASTAILLELPDADGEVVLGSSLDTALDRGEPVPMVPAAADTPVLLLHTSGSTALPKAVLWTQGAEAWSAAAHAGIWHLKALDRIAVPLTLAWAYGLCTVTLSSLRAGATVILMPHFRPDELAFLIAKERVTHLFGVTTMYTLLDQFLEQAKPTPDLSSLEIMVTDARPNTETFRRLERLSGARTLEVYAMSEIRPVMTYDPLADEAVLPGCCGRVVEGVEVKLVDEYGAEVAENQPGELWARSPGMLKEYYLQPEVTAQRLTPDRWFRTADIFERGRDGYWYFQSRASDVIRRGGASVSPREVEKALLRHPKVSEVLVVGVRDPVYMEAVGALVVGGFSTDVDASLDLRTFAARQLAHFKVPTIVRVVGAIPKTSTGKLDRRAARDLLEQNRERSSLQGRGA